VSAVYAVRCNFSRPDLEGRWHAWYNGPKTDEMLAKPGFLSGQRYRAAGMDQAITYLALWVLESPEALKTPAYTAQWGFADWSAHITDWSRNLYRAPDGDACAILDVPAKGALYFAALDAVPADEAEARRRAFEAARPDVTWLPVIGLDMSCPAIGVRVLPAIGQPPDPLPPHLAAGIRETLYAPLAACRCAGSLRSTPSRAPGGA